MMMGACSSDALIIDCLQDTGTTLEIQDAQVTSEYQHSNEQQQSQDSIKNNKKKNLQYTEIYYVCEKNEI
jgi:hypoxanthine phosphoribosyltransferase